MDYSTWLTKLQAAEAIGCSTKTIEKLAAEGKIQRGTRKNIPTGALIAVYHPQDVRNERLVRNPAAEAFILPPAPSQNAEKLPNGMIAVPVANRAGTELVSTKERQNWQALAQLVTQLPKEPSIADLWQKLFVTPDEAVRMTGLAKGYLGEYLDGYKIGPRCSLVYKVKEVRLLDA